MNFFVYIHIYIYIYIYIYVCMYTYRYLALKIFIKKANFVCTFMMVHDSFVQSMFMLIFKKIFIADNLATIVGQIYEPRTFVGGPGILIGMYAFTFQIYGDFSGYSDIARGLARWMGVELMENFRLPLWAVSPRDLWHRWHISLSQWLRDYLYIPLGGNRKGSTQRNLLMTMILGGLWHGANWTFIVWGTLHGLALLFQHQFFPKGPQSVPTRLLGVLLTFHLTAFCFLIFRAHSLSQVYSFLELPWRWAVEDPQRIRQFLVVVLPLLGIEAITRFRDDPFWPLKLPPLLQAIFYLLLFGITLILGASFGQQFIYFQF